jgi:hypothetical protein
MKEKTLERIIDETLLISSMTGILDERIIDIYRMRQKARNRFKEIQENGYSENSEGEKW